LNESFFTFEVRFNPDGPARADVMQGKIVGLLDAYSFFKREWKRLVGSDGEAAIVKDCGGE